MNSYDPPIQALITEGHWHFKRKLCPLSRCPSSDLHPVIVPKAGLFLQFMLNRSALWCVPEGTQQKSAIHILLILFWLSAAIQADRHAIALITVPDYIQGGGMPFWQDFGLCGLDPPQKPYIIVELWYHPGKSGKPSSFVFQFLLSISYFQLNGRSFVDMIYDITFIVW